MMETSTEQLLEEISAKLDRILAALLIAGREQNVQIGILRSYNFEWNEIGQMVGLNADAARKRFKPNNKHSKRQ